MKYTFATTSAALLATALAQDNPLNIPLPSDLAAYVSSQASNTAAIAAIQGIFTYPAVLSVVQAAPTLGAGPLIVDFQSAVGQAISAQPSALQPVASSVYNQIASYAVTDGFLQQLQGGGSGSGAASATATSGGMMSNGTAPATASASATGMSGGGVAAGNGTMTPSNSTVTAGQPTGVSTGSSGSGSGSGAGGSTMATGSRTGGASGTGSGAASSSTAAGSGADSLHITGFNAALLAGGVFAVFAL